MKRDALMRIVESRYGETDHKACPECLQMKQIAIDALKAEESEKGGMPMPSPLAFLLLAISVFISGVAVGLSLATAYLS